MSEVEKQLVAIEMVRASKTAPVAASTATPAAQRTGAAVPPADALAPAVVRADASNRYAVGLSVDCRPRCKG